MRKKVITANQRPMAYYIARFEAYLSARYSAHTARNYAYDVNSFVKAAGIECLHDIDYLAVLDYITGLDDERSTAAHKFYAIKKFCKWLNKTYAHRIDLPDGDDVPRPPRPLPRPIPEDDFERLIERLKSAPELPERDRTIGLLLADTGCRVSEILALNVADITPLDGRFDITVRGKGGQSRIVSVVEGDESYGALAAARLQYKSGYLFRSLSGRPYSYRAFNQKWVAHVSRQYTPHQLRHTLATRMANTPGITHLDIMKQLGHRSLNTVLVYSQLSDDEHLKKMSAVRAQRILKKD